jgi:hypothetical protein
VSSVAIAGFFSESRLRLLDSFMPYRNEGMSEGADMDQSCGTESPYYRCFRPTGMAARRLDQKLGAVLLAGIMCLISLTLAALTFSSRAVSRTPRPSSRAARIRPIRTASSLTCPGAR